MTEQEIINLVTLIANNMAIGKPTHAEHANVKLITALERLVKVARERPQYRYIDTANDTMRYAYQQRYDEMEGDYYRIKTRLDKLEERIKQAEEVLRKATDRPS